MHTEVKSVVIDGAEAGGVGQERRKADVNRPGGCSVRRVAPQGIDQLVVVGGTGRSTEGVNMGWGPLSSEPGTAAFLAT